MSAPSVSSGGEDEMPSRIAEEPPSVSRVIALQGDLDIDTSPGLRDQLNALLAGGVVTIVLDCAALDYIDSTGLGTLVSALKQTANRDGALALAQPSERVRELLRVTGLDKLFLTFPGVSEACDALGVPVAAPLSRGGHEIHL